MKTILIITMFATMQIVNSQSIINNSIGFQHTPFVQAVCHELEINETINIFFDNRINADGFAVKTVFGEYIVFVNSNIDNRKIKEVLAHELCHIRDDINGIWDLNNSTTKVYKWGYRYVSKETERIERRINEEGKTLAFKYRNVLRTNLISKL